MKQVLVALFFNLLVSGTAIACSVGPERIDYQEVEGFEVEISRSDFCESCERIRILAPETFRGIEYSAGTFSTFLGGEFFSRSVHTYISDDGRPEFVGLVRSDKDYFSEITFGYGSFLHCLTFEIVYTR